MAVFEQLNEWYTKRHDYAKAWKERNPGKKVVGVFCTYYPEELFYAADILPVRILGSHEPQGYTEPHILGMYCPFCRDVLAQGLQGRYPYLDGIVEAQSCLHLRQAYHSWRLHVPVDFAYYIPVPHANQTPRAIPYLAAELADFKKALEDWTGKTITDDDLRRGIAIVNENRRLMREIYELRKDDEPKLTGQEATIMVCSSQMSDKREHTEVLKKLLKELPNRKIDREIGTRFLIVGSENDDMPFLGMVESLGTTVVIEDTCCGSRYFWNTTDEEEAKSDPLMAIARRYVQRPPCPSKDHPKHTRFDHILKLCQDFNVEAALVCQQKFCDPHEGDIPSLRAFLDRNGVPNYLFELDVTVPLGPFKIRFEAFLEMLHADDLFA